MLSNMGKSATNSMCCGSFQHLFLGYDGVYKGTLVLKQVITVYPEQIQITSAELAELLSKNS